jgi:hypothetical protein
MELTNNYNQQTSQNFKVSQMIIFLKLLHAGMLACSVYRLMMSFKAGSLTAMDQVLLTNQTSKRGNKMLIKT